MAVHTHIHTNGQFSVNIDPISSLSVFGPGEPAVGAEETTSREPLDVQQEQAPPTVGVRGGYRPDRRRRT